MKKLLLPIAMLLSAPNYAQKEDLGWIAPEGKILNYRTLTWDDFQGEEDKKHAEDLASRNLQAQAYVCPAIYYQNAKGERLDNGRVKFDFKMKCAFQSRAFVRESTKQDHTNYVLVHEQDHYDIALIYTSKLQRELCSRDYSADKYDAEIDKIYDDIMAQYHKTQETYDHEVNPEGRDDREKQYLWDMRIKKCLENNTDEYFTAPESSVQSVKALGQVVKRIPGEPALQFVVRSRPLYSEFPADMTSKIVTTTEWGSDTSIIAFYTQKYYLAEDGAQPKDLFRTLAYAFVPTVKDTYKRILIDTFTNNGQPVKIATAFFANADSDNVKELVIMATATQKEKGTVGTLYMNRAYDAAVRPLPGKLKKLNDVTAKLDGGFEGTLDSKPSKAAYKSTKDVADALTKMGYK